jgi:hypothetical protein
MPPRRRREFASSTAGFYDGPGQMTESSRLFDEFNRRYWRGRLPRYRVIRWRFKNELLGRCDNKRRTILLRSDLRGETLRLTLLHEMCHIGKGRGYDHGPVFLRKAHRLVKLGESKLIEDIEQYDGTAVSRYIEKCRSEGRTIPEIPFRQAVIDDLDSLAQTEYQRRWPKVVSWLAKQYRMSPSKFRRVAPWAEREWRQASKIYRECARKPAF